MWGAVLDSVYLHTTSRDHLDERTGRHLGNFPQAFTHLAQINAIMHVIEAESRGLRHGPESLSPNQAVWVVPDDEPVEQTSMPDQA